MTIRFDIKADERALAEAKALFEFFGGNSRDAIRVAINRTLRKVKSGSSFPSNISSRVRSEVRLPASYVNKRLKVLRASRFNLIGRISTPSRGILMSRYSTDPLIAGEKVSWVFPPPVPPRGIRIKIKPNEPPKLFQGDRDINGKPFFLVLKESNRIAVAGRRKVPGPRGGKFKVFYSPSLSQVYATLKDRISDDASTLYTEELADAMRYLLAKRYPPE